MQASEVIWDWKTDASAMKRANLARRNRIHGVVQGLAGVVLGLLFFVYWHRIAAYVVFSVAALSLLAATLSPTGLYQTLKRGLARFGAMVGTLVATLLLTPIFYLFFSLFRLFFRGGSRNSMHNWTDKHAASYWLDRGEPRDKASYERQF